VSGKTGAPLSKLIWKDKIILARQKLKLTPHLNVEDLKRRYRSCRDAKEARRWHVLWLVDQGLSVKEAAEMVGIGLSWAREIVHRYNREGPQSVEDRHKLNPGGKKPRLDEQLKKELIETLKNTPPGGGEWTGAKIAAWIQQKTGIATYPQLGWVYMRTFITKARSKEGKDSR
jgi:transposase